MNALITGSATGFGRLTVELLSAAGHTVFATMRGTTTRNAETSARLGSLPGVRVVELDVTADESVASAVSQVLAEVGHVDCVVNNAGFAGFGITEGFTIDQWQAVLNTNLLGAVRMNNAVLPSMRARKSGLLVHVTSIAGRVPVPYLVPYATSKWALECYAESLRLELTPLGVDSVVVEPGKYRTSIFEKTDSASPPSQLQDEYGTADLTGPFMDWFMTNMDQLAQDPRDVAAAIVKLMETPFGQRPFRTPVGRDATWIQPYNDFGDGIRAEVARQAGLLELLQRDPETADDALRSSAGQK